MAPCLFVLFVNTCTVYYSSQTHLALYIFLVWYFMHPSFYVSHWHPWGSSTNQNHYVEVYISPRIDPRSSFSPQRTDVARKWIRSPNANGQSREIKPSVFIGLRPMDQLLKPLTGRSNSKEYKFCHPSQRKWSRRAPISLNAMVWLNRLIE